jgi:hypothetical protein
MPAERYCWEWSAVSYNEMIGMFRFSWKWRRRSSSKVKERTHEEATEAIRARREGRHPEAAFAGKGTHIEVM